jgi:hypothetical protein
MRVLPIRQLLKLSTISSLSILSINAMASEATGLTWLQQAANGSGGVNGEQASIGTVLQARSETASALKLLGASSSVSTADLATDESSAESLVRQIYIAKATGIDPSGYLTILLAMQNTDGGFGHLQGWQSNPLDTAFALLALNQLSTSSSINDSVVQNAIGYLQTQARADGSYQVVAADPLNTLYVSSRVLSALTLYVQKYPAITNNILTLVNYLEQQQLAPGQWTNVPQGLFLDGLLTEALHPFRTTVGSAGQASESAFRSRALAQQSSDGSWQGDPYTTAIVLRALKVQSQTVSNPIASTVSLTVIDNETGLALPNVTVATTANSPAQISAQTDVTGLATFKDTVPGSYHFTLNKSGYNQFAFDVILKSGESLNMGQVRLDHEINSSSTQVVGYITDGVTRQAIAGAQVTIVSGGQTQTVQTGPDGAYQVYLAQPNSFTVTISKTGYATFQGAGDAAVGSTTALSAQLTTDSINIATIQGTVVDQSGTPLIGVSVLKNGITVATTNAQGAFSVSGTTSGLQQITLQKDQYLGQPVSLSIPAGGTANIGTLTMSAVGAAQPANQTGTVTVQLIDNSNNAFLKNALITAEQLDANDQVIQTQSFQPVISPGVLQLPVGRWRLTVSRDGYRNIGGPSTTIVNVAANQSQNVTLKLQLDTFDFKFVLVDSQTNKVVPNANIQVIATGSKILVYQGRTDQNGVYSISSNFVGQFSVIVQSEAYLPTTRNFDRGDAPIGFTWDAGQIRIRPLSAEIILPDLVVTQTDTSAIATDQQSLQITGQLKATITNKGKAPLQTSYPIKVSAFVDTNHNKILDSNEIVLGQTTFNTPLPISGSTDVTILVVGKALFRDAPIAVWVDSDLHVVESRKDNNVRSTSDGVEIRPALGALDPEVAWFYGPTNDYPYGAPENSFNVTPPAAAPLEDTNGDGKIGLGDIASIAYVTIEGKLVVLDGKTGVKKWGTDALFNITPIQPTNQTLQYSYVTIADIDNDGSPDVIAENLNSGLIYIYDHNGVVKRTTSTPTGRGSHLTIADLDADGSPEIITGESYYNYTQNKWTNYAGYPISTIAPVTIADLNGDGFPEIIGNSQIIDIHNGNRVYPLQGIPSYEFLNTPAAVADLYQTKKPVLISVVQGNVYINAADGTLLSVWQHHLGGFGGAPVIADFDGDGRPDIGIAGGSYYGAFRSDGTLIWTTPIHDQTSRITGSTVFDFNGDGQSEVVYADEQKLMILDAATGHELFSIPHSSGTLYEYPLVLDADGDGHADIILGDSSFNKEQFDTTNGIYYNGMRMISGHSKNWANTRNIWNQSSYHVTNINDDMSVPQHEANSWEVHNTYRANLLLNGNSVAAIDATASYIQVKDNGSSAASTFKVRIGNAGGKILPIGAPVSFYQTPPNSPVGTAPQLVGTVLTTKALGSGEFEDVAYSYSGSLAGFGQLTIVANDHGAGSSTEVQEFTRTNNTATLAIAGGNQALTLSSSLDKPAYQPADSVTITATATNLGSFAAQPTVRYTILDSVGNVVATLPDQTPSLDASTGTNASASVPATWAASGARVGAYTVRTDLIQQGAVVASITTPFQIGSDAASSGLTSTSLSVDKQQYSAADTVTISEHVQNTSTNTVGGPVTVVTTILNPDGSTRWSQSATYAELVPQQLQQQSYQVPLANAPAGIYTVTTTTTTAAGQAPYSSQTSFTVLSSSQTATGIKGSLTGAASVLIGSTESFNWNISNNGNTALSNLPVRIIVINPVTGDLLTTVTSSTQTLAQNSSLAAQTTNWQSTGPSNTPLVAVLQIQTSTGNWQTLAQQPLTLVLPPVSIALSTDKTSYNIQQNAIISISDTNQSTATLSGATSKTVITAPNGAVFKTETATQATWAPGAVWTQSYSEALGRAQAGTWTIVHSVSLANGTVLKTQSASFSVASTAATGLGLQGTLAATPAQVPLGQPVALNLQVANQGNADLANLPLTVGLYKNGATTAAQTFNYTVPTLAQTSTAQQAFSWTPTGVANDQYSAVLRSSVGGQSNTLALASFSLLPPPVSVTFPTSPSGANNVLVYYSCQPGWFSGLLGWTLGVYTHSCFNDRATTLRSYLDSLGVSYTLTYVPSQFSKLMRSGKYNNFWVLGAVEKITTNTNDELRELVNNGSPVVFDSGLYSWLNYELYDLVDIRYRGHINLQDRAITPTAPVYTPSTLLGQPKAAAWPLLVKPGSHTTVTATYSASQCTVDRDWIGALETLPDLLFYNAPVSTYPAIVTSSYGLSKPIGLTFDLISSLSQASGTPTTKASWQELLKQTLAATQVDTTQRTSYVPSELITLPLTLNNQGPATPVTILVELPAGAVWQGTGTPDASNRVVINQTLTANATQTIPLPLRLPTTTATHGVRLSVYNGTLSSPITASTIATQQLNYNVVDLATRLSSVRSAVNGWSVFSLDGGYIVAAQTQMNIAQLKLSLGFDDLAIAALAEAGEQMSQMTHTSNSAATRQALDELMRAVQYRWYLQQTP